VKECNISTEAERIEWKQSPVAREFQKAIQSIIEAHKEILTTAGEDQFRFVQGQVDGMRQVIEYFKEES
jgi:hypothetical protein